MCKCFFNSPFYLYRVLKMLLLWSIWYMCCGRSGCWKDRTCRGLEGNGSNWNQYWYGFNWIQHCYHDKYLTYYLTFLGYWPKRTSACRSLLVYGYERSHGCRRRYAGLLEIAYKAIHYKHHSSKEFWDILYLFRDWKLTSGRHQMPMSEINLLAMDKTYE